MLKKIIKHEIKLSIREIGIISIILIIAGIIFPLLIKTEKGLLISLGASSYAIILCGTLLMPIIILYRIFYKSMFGSEGYLTNIIPAKTSSIVIGKFISAIILIVIIQIAVFISILLFVGIITDINAIAEVIASLGEGFKYIFTNSVWLWTFLNIIVLFSIYTLSCIAVFFFVATIFSTFKTRKYKFLVLYLLYTLITRIIGSIVIIPMIFILRYMNDNNIILLSNIMILYASLMYAAFFIGLIIGTIRMIDKKVDIQ